MSCATFGLSPLISHEPPCFPAWLSSRRLRGHLGATEEMQPEAMSLCGKEDATLIRPSRERGIVFCGIKPVRSGIVSRRSWGTLTKSQISTLKYRAAIKAKPNEQQTKRTTLNSGVISLADRQVTGRLPGG